MCYIFPKIIVVTWRQKSLLLFYSLSLMAIYSFSLCVHVIPYLHNFIIYLFYPAKKIAYLVIVLDFSCVSAEIANNDNAKFYAAFTRQTKVGKLVLANSSWCLGTAQKQSANTFYLSPTVCHRVCRLFLRRSHIPTWVSQHESTNFSLPCEGRFRG